MIIKHNLDDLNKYLRKILRKTKGLKREIGDEMKAQTVKRITVEKRSPEGVKWRPLSREYRLRKARRYSGGILVRTGNLYKGLEVRVRRDVIELNSYSPYGRVHQFGYVRNKVPKRKFLGFSNENKKAIINIVKKTIENA